jgi:nitrogen fixation protein FixH
MKTKPPRNLWPTAITTFFVIAILGIATFITWAVHQGQDLVAPDYYEREIRFQKELEARGRAHTLSKAPEISYDVNAHTLRIRIAPNSSAKVFGRVQLYRPADARLDQVLPLELDPSGLQQFDTRRLQGGLWKVHVRWVVDGAEFSYHQSVVIAGT